MKKLIGLFFKALRRILGPLLLFSDWLTTPRGLVRSAPAQQAVDAATRSLTLYQFKTCPFCMKVRRAARRLSLHLTTRDAQHDAAARAELQQATGKVQVPCLRIVAADGAVTWILESDVIVRYLEKRFAGTA